MINSFRCAETQAIFEGFGSRKFRNVELAAKRRLDYLNASRSLAQLAQLRGNRLEALKGDRWGQYSIRVNDQYRICFEWWDGGAYNVEIVDYH